MLLKNILDQKKATIIKKWFEIVAETYPADTSKFLKNKKDQFDNPVGNAILKGVTGLFDELLNRMDYESVKNFLDPVIRIRAVQPLFSPSRAIGFIFLLKKIIRENLKKQSMDKQIADELLEFELKIDELSLIAFDIYMECREKLYDIKASQEKTKIYKAFKRAGLVTEIPQDEDADKASAILVDGCN